MEWPTSVAVLDDYTLQAIPYSCKDIRVTAA